MQADMLKSGEEGKCYVAQFALAFQPGASYLTMNHIAIQKIGDSKKSLWWVNV